MSCGGGIQTHTRNCSNPEPANGGLNCTGMAVETQNCNQLPCPLGKVVNHCNIIEENVNTFCKYFYRGEILRLENNL
jgi:hypothetical protein